MTAVLNHVASASLEQLDGTEVVIRGKTIVIGELSINQTIASVRLVGDVVARMQSADVRKFVAAVKDAADSEDAAESEEGREGASIRAILELLDEQTINGLLAVVTREPAAWCGDNVGLTSLGRIVEALVEHNDLRPLVRSFGRAAQGWSSPRSDNSSTQPTS